jgi:hypothetical protein
VLSFSKIVIGHYEMYRRWIRDQKLDPREFRWVGRTIDLVGYHNVDVVLLPNHTRLTDWDEMKIRLRFMEITGNVVRRYVHGW